MGTNYKPFNLEEAKKGAPVMTISGKDVRIVCFDVISYTYPLLALVREDEAFGFPVEIPRQYQQNGQWLSKITIEDLVMK